MRIPPFRPGVPGAAIPIYLLLSGMTALLFGMVFTVNLLYHVQTVGLSPLQLVLVGTVLEVVIVLFEIPTGVVADVVSRRRSVLIGFALIGCGFIVEGSMPAFGAILAAQVLWGIGHTFTSGATEAWITDEVGDQHVGPVLLRGGQAGLIGSITGIVLGTALGLVAIQLPIVLGGVGFLLLTLVLLRIMPETGFRPTPREDRSTFGHMVDTARAGITVARTRPVVRVLLVTSLLLGLASEAFDRLWVAHLVDTVTFPDLLGTSGDDTLVLWLGIFLIAGQTLSLLTTEALVRFRPQSLGPGTPTRMLAGLATVHVLATAGFALVGSLWLAMGLLWVRGLARHVMQPVENAWLQRNIEGSTRATVLSVREQVGSVGEIGGGPPLGWVGSRFGVTAALLSTALVYLPTAPVYLRASHLRDHAATDDETTSGTTNRP